MKPSLLLSAWPYIAFSLLVLGVAVRCLLERQQMAVGREEMREAWALFRGSRVWRGSVILLVLGHALMLVFPQAVTAWGRNPLRLYFLEALGFAAGVAALAGWVALLWRHLGRANRSAITELSDTIFIALLLVGIVSGLLMAALYRWGSSWGAIILTPYVVSLLRLRPAPELAAQMPFLIRLHVFSVFAAFAVLPLTRLAAFLVFAVHAALALGGRLISSAERGAQAWLRKHNPAPWLWPEED
jgi:nitrate reductase gamma subunit